MSNRRPPSAELSWDDLAEIEAREDHVLPRVDYRDREKAKELAPVTLTRTEHTILCRTIRALCVERDRKDAPSGCCFAGVGKACPIHEGGSGT